MMSLPSPKMIVISLLIAIGVFALPIDEATVTRHTSVRLGRTVLSQLFSEPNTETGVLHFTGDPDVEKEIRKLIQRRQYATLVEDNAPILAIELRDTGSRVELRASFAGKSELSSARKASSASLIPPVLAVLLALLLRNVIVSLFVGIWVGVTVLVGGNPGLGVVRVVTDYVYPVITDSFNLQILGFTFGLVGMVGVIGRMGGTLGLVNAASRFAKGPRSAQGVTAMMGTLIFFDDYANTVVVGTTARALTDRLRVSREKLAYIVDSTSAPVAGVALISTWIGYEVGLFESLLVEFAHVAGVPQSGYALFFEVLPFRFYCFFALALVFLTALLGRDFGSMYNAEVRVRQGGPVVPPQGEGEPDSSHAGGLALEKPGVPPRMMNALVPIAAVLGFIAYRIWQSGVGAVHEELNPFSLDHWRIIFTKGGDEIGSILLAASAVGSVVAIGLSFGQRLLTPKEVFWAYSKGVTSLLGAGTILILAWVIKNVCDDFSTGLALVGMVGDTLPVVALPMVVFLLAGVVAFSTGTSWGTMALLLPVAAPLATSLSGELSIILICMGAVLDGAIWGDHCSPISDTTVLSSTATGCPHMDHVRTQLPYASLAMVVAATFGYLGYAFGAPVWMIYPGGILVMVGGLIAFGKKA